MKLRYLLIGVSLAFALVLTVQSVGLANAIVNGDFENTAGWGPGLAGHPYGWDTPNGNPASPQSGTAAIGGSGTSAYMAAAGNGATIDQSFAQLGPQWTYSMDFAASDPGGDADRTCDIALNFNGGNIYFRVVDRGANGIGDIQFHNSAGSGWTSVTALQDSVLFSANLTTAPVANHLQIVSHFDLASPTYDAIVTNGSGTFTATDLGLFNTGTPATGSSPQTMSLCSQLNGNSWVADNVSLTVPEPNSVVLLLTGLIGLLCYAWRNWK